MKSMWNWTLALAFVALVPCAHAGGLFDGLGAQVGKSFTDRLGKTSANAIDKAFGKIDGAVNCVAGDPECSRGAREGRPETGTVPSGSGSAHAR
jgi:hypothetical protein